MKLLNSSDLYVTLSKLPPNQIVTIKYISRLLKQQKN